MIDYFDEILLKLMKIRSYKLYYNRIDIFI